MPESNFRTSKPTWKGIACVHRKLSESESKESGDLDVALHEKDQLIKELEEHIADLNGTIELQGNTIQV